MDLVDSSHLIWDCNPMAGVELHLLTQEHQEEIIQPDLKRQLEATTHKHQVLLILVCLRMALQVDSNPGHQRRRVSCMHQNVDSEFIVKSFQ